MTPEQHAEIARQVAAMPAVCSFCKTSTTYGETKIVEQPILRCNPDGTPKPVYHGMATIREYRVCKTH